MEKTEKPKCPGCKQADADYRQDNRPHLCAWCGYNHDTGEQAGFVSASDIFDDLISKDDDNA